MAKKTAATILALCLLLLSAGCSAMLESEYYFNETFDDTVSTDTSDAGRTVSDYANLRQSIRVMVESHTETGKIRVSGYSGDLNVDLDKACWEIQSTTPMGAYAVGAISCWPNRMVSYYEVNLHINYKRTKEQVDAIISAGSAEGLRQAVAQALNEGSSYLALRMTTSMMDAENVKEIIRQEFLSNPIASPKAPETDIKTYPDSGLSRIFEITIDYKQDPQELEESRGRMLAAGKSLAAAAVDLPPAQAAKALFLALAESCVLDDAGTGEFSAYGALCEGRADSFGFAAAYNALLRLCGLNGTIISGTKKGAPHAWNIVEIDGAYYHADVSSAKTQGVTVLLRGDASVGESYRWDAPSYPQCEADFSG